MEGVLGLLINEPQHSKAAQEKEEDHQDGGYEDDGHNPGTGCFCWGTMRQVRLLVHTQVESQGSHIHCDPPTQCLKPGPCGHTDPEIRSLGVFDKFHLFPGSS